MTFFSVFAFNFFYIISQLRHSLVVHPLLSKILGPPLLPIVFVLVVVVVFCFVVVVVVFVFSVISVLVAVWQ